MGDWHSRYFLRSSLAYHVTRCTIPATCNQISGELLRKGNRTSDRWNVVQRRSTAEGRSNLVNRDSINGFFALLLSFSLRRFFHLYRALDVTQFGLQVANAAPAVVVFGSKSIGHFPLAKLSNVVAENTKRESSEWIFNVRENVTRQSPNVKRRWHFLIE